MYWRLISLEEIIQIWDNRKSVIGLQVRAFKNYNKLTLAYKDYWRERSTNTHFSIEKQPNKDWNTPIHFESNSPS